MDILNWHGAGACIRYSATQGFAKLVRQNNGAKGE